jgi:response regulator RpfG family c-di-GMP phosphodiesterase
MTEKEAPRRQTVLVVDDTPDDVQLLVALLKGICRVRVASTGPRALEIAATTERPDLILLDVMMPGMDGYEVCRRLKRDPGTREIPVLFLTSRHELQNEARGFASGAGDYITKPFSAALVLARVRTHLERGRLLAAERELLEKTLKGSLAVILEMIAMEDPEGSGGNSRMAELSEEVARSLGMEDPWMVGLAGVLSRIGALTVPSSVLEKVKGKSILNTEERQAYNRIPEVGYRLLKHIPRMEDVAEMIFYSQKNYNGTGFPPDDRAGEDIPLGGRILRACHDFTNSRPALENASRRLNDMFLTSSFYDATVLMTLKKIVESGCFATPAEEAVTVERPILDLLVGQVLGRTVETADGLVLLRQGAVLTASLLEKLTNFALIGAIQGPVSVREDPRGRIPGWHMPIVRDPGPCPALP